MRKRSFGLIIMITLILGAGIVSFSAFHIFSHYLEKIINKEAEKNILATLRSMKQQFYLAFEKHDGTIIKDIVKNVNAEGILNSYLYNADGQLVFSLKEEEANGSDISIDDLSGINEDVYLKSMHIGKETFSRVYLKMQNSPSCHKCHSPELESLGFLVLDVSSNRAGLDIFISKSSVIFTIVVVTIIALLVIFMHYKFVRKSIVEFTATINRINNGDLGTRLTIPETKELGMLGKNFNSMLDTLQKAQLELQEFHRKELRSNYKLASIGEMAAKLAHQIRNPITGISNAIEIIVKESKDAQYISVLKEIQHQAKRINNSITSILKYSRKKDLIFEKNDINEVIKSLVPFLKNIIDGKQIQLNLNFDENIPDIKFDRVQMEDVLLNVVLNAIQAIEEKGSVTIGTKFNYPENYIFISVSDSGTGIPEENLSSVFHPFFTTKKEGTGLGLAVVKDILDKHGAEISVENNKTGGCTFTISMPVENK